ncbi:MAG TPA: ATP-binding protein [Candidatus Paceibacterota bacterium]|nr:ATP-binding protein [Candidatus Paceibacterota bacterium]
MGITALVDINFDLLSVGVAIAGIILLGFLIYLTNPRSITSRTFFYFSILTAIWGVSNYLEYKFTTIDATLWALRFHLFLSTLHALLFFQLAYVFPKDKVTFPRWYKFGLIPIVGMTMILVLTPFVFSGITALAPPGYVTNPERGPGIIIFSIVAFGLLIAGVTSIIRKAWGSTEVQERKQEYSIAAGMALTAILILLFNVFLPVFLNQLSFIPLAALFLLPFIALISYAIYRHRLFNFNLKVATAGLLGFMVTVFSFVNIIYSVSLSAVAINITAFIIVLIGSVKIVMDMLNLEKLSEELEQTNERQEGLLHFIGHEVKGFLTKDMGTFAALLDGDFGALSQELRPLVERALAQSRDGVDSVADILKASNQKKGTMTYKKEPFDLKALAAEIAEKERPGAEAKGLALSFAADDSQSYQMTGDRAELGSHVLRNLIENAINYTPSGSIAVSLKKENGKLVFAVKDTGVGITDEDKARLFTEGGHGKESQKVNVYSTGYGLYIAKNIVAAHGGTIRAESAGQGRGSTFIVELPA